LAGFFYHPGRFCLAPSSGPMLRGRGTVPIFSAPDAYGCDRIQFANPSTASSLARMSAIALVKISFETQKLFGPPHRVAFRLKRTRPFSEGSAYLRVLRPDVWLLKRGVFPSRCADKAAQLCAGSHRERPLAWSLALGCRSREDPTIPRCYVSALPIRCSMSRSRGAEL